MDTVEIVQSYLNEVGLAVMADDWPTYCSAVCLPFHIVSHDENKVVATLDDLRAGYDLFRDMLRLQRVTDYIRLVEGASRLDPDLISGRYVSHLISGSQRVVTPFRSEMVLRRAGNRWSAVSITNSLRNSRWPLVRLDADSDEALKGPPT